MSSRGERHLDSVDLMRVLTVAGVVAVHVVTGTSLDTSVAAGAATVLLHVNREVFVLITALVLTYSYASREGWSLRAFWARRYWLVGVPYVVWSAIYFLANGVPAGPVQALRQLALDLATGTARYHLYFLLVSMQLYLVFPALLLLVRATRRHHWLLLAASVAVQLAFTAAIHYGPRPGGPIGWWMDHPDALLPSYQLYVLAGAVVAVRLGELTGWVRRHAGLVVALVASGIAAGLASYLADVSLRVLRPVVASEVFQPAVTVESLAVVLGLFALGVGWADRLRPAWLAGAVRRASDASFGIYLAHPLVLQGVLALAGVTGALPAILRLPSHDTLAIGLLAFLPLVLALTWFPVQFARRSPLSLALTGRQAAGARDPGRRPAWVAAGLQTLALGVALAASVSWMDLSSVRLAAPGAASGGTPAASPSPLAAVLSAADAPRPPAGAESAVENIWVGGLLRSYQVIRPERPAAARLPAIVFLHGVNATVGYEEARDGLLPLAASGQAVLVYPVGYEQSWNAGVCCGAAEVQDLDDVGFLTAVAQRLAGDPGVDEGRIALAGYSNGGKMAYRLACEQPDLFSSVTVVLALPVAPCPSGPPVTLLHVAVEDDSEIPYAPGDGPLTANGVLLTPVTSEVADWRSRDGCGSGATIRVTGQLRTELWPQCRSGTRVELATYAAGGHLWPAGDASTPPAGQVVWTFVNAVR